MKRIIPLVVILAMLASFLQLASFSPTVKASPGVEVVCVPWKGDEWRPHSTWSGKEVTLKGTVRYEGEVAWTWDFGDGSAPATGSVTVTDDYPCPISVKHAYSASIGSVYAATLTVIAGAESDSDVYLLQVLEETRDAEADVAIDEGLWWLYQGQYRYASGDADLGYWVSWGRVASTSAAVQAFENNLHKPSGETSKDPYVDCVRRGLNFLFSMAYKVTIPPEDPHGGDTNANGFGIACHDWEWGGREMYEVGMAMMAIVSSDIPGRQTVTGPDGVIGRTYQDVVQDMADYCAWAQNDGVPDDMTPGIYAYDFGSGVQSLVSAGTDDRPDISGDKLVWMDYRNGSADIYMYDFSTGTETPICIDPADQLYPSISGDKVVWFDDRAGSYDIYMYDLSNGTETPICTDPAGQYVPTVSGDIVTWTDDRNGQYDIYMYDLSNGTETPICVDPADQLWQNIDGDNIVWMDSRNGNYDIYMYDLGTGTENPICIDSAPQEYPAISGERVVWQDSRNGQYDIYMHDLSSSSETPISIAPGNQYYPDIAGDKIVWMDYRNGKIDADVYAYDLASVTETAICFDAGDQYYPAVSSGTIVWVTQPYGYSFDPNRVGGWRYQPNFNDSDNSVTQWPIMGLAPAEAKWGIDVPDFVKERLEQWLTYSQCKQEGYPYGGYGYTGPDWPNVARTAGSGLSGLVFCGVPVGDERIQNALSFVDRAWADDNFGNEYAMYAVKKAYEEYMGMENTGSHDWWDEYADYLIPLQQVDGHWDRMGSWSSGNELTTAWVILILTPGVYDIPPNAVAKTNGFDSTEVDVDQMVHFDASQSTNGSYEIVKYEWDWESDGIYDAEGVTATHSYPAYGTYQVTLKVIDNRDVATGGKKQAMTDTDTCIVWVHEPPHPPIADANGPYNGWPCEPVTLDGSGSYDPNVGDSIAVYAWDLDNDGVFETITDIPTVPFVRCEENVYPVALIVRDDSPYQLWCTEPYRTIVKIGNSDPVADPNGPYESSLCQEILLDGSGSHDADEPMGDYIVAYEWDLNNDGVYDDATGPQVPFKQCTPGFYTVRLRVTDTLGATDTAETSVNVKPNRPPVAVDDTYSTNEDTTLNVPAPGVLANDTDPDGDTLSAILVDDVDHGTLALNPDGSFAYTPAADYVGSDTFTCIANDGKEDSNVATVTITVLQAWVPATMDFDPDTLNLGSQGKVVTVYIELPTGYNVRRIDVSSIRLNGTVPALARPTAIGDYDKDGIPDLMVKFDRAAVEKILVAGDHVEVTITGKVAGIDFEGSDTIRVIAKGKVATAGVSNIPYLGYIMAGLLGCWAIAIGMVTFLMWGRPLPNRN